MFDTMINMLTRVIKNIMPAKMKSFIRKNILSLLGIRYYDYSLLSFSQAGEDCVLRFLFKDYSLELSKVSYLDIGARHPTGGSNTFLFYAAGSHGVCVDADNTFIPLHEQVRPRDKVLNVGISNSFTEYGSLYFMEGGGSTFDKEEAAKRVSLWKAEVNKVFEIPLLDINTLIKQNFDKYPHFLSIDIEGLDLPVLKNFYFDKYPVPVICAETCIYSENHIRPKDTTIAEFLISKGYEVYADTYVNTIFVNKKWFYHLT